MNNSILVFSKLKSQVNFEDTEKIKLDEPLHPYVGYNWSLSIRELGFIVEYLNSKRSEGSARSLFLDWFYNYLKLPSSYNILVVHSTNGLLRTTILRLFNLNKEIIYYYLSLPNPDGGKVKKIIRRICVFFDCLSASKVVYGLDCLINEFPLNSFSSKAIYFPFYVDFNFFQRQLEIDQSNLEWPIKFVLIVGDITRDDDYVYKELKHITIPVIRITRDLIVVERVRNLFNESRGDLVLTGISFNELAHLYRNSLCCITASKYDHWQPGGITSMVESFACGGICISNSNGQIQSEFNFLSQRHNFEDPTIYYSYPKSGELVKIINYLDKLGDDSISIMKNKSQKFAYTCFNFNSVGEIELSKLFNEYRN